MAIRLSREERAASSNRGASKLPPLSPAFLHEVDAANWAHQEIGQRRDVEYGGVILRDPTGQYFSTRPVRGEGMQFDLRTVLGIGTDGYYLQPQGYTCVASYHSHPAQHAWILQRNRSFDERMAKAFLGFMSGTDFYRDVHDRDFFPSSYLSGPDGSLIRHTPSGSAAEFSFALWVQAGKPPDSPVGVYGGFDDFVKKISTFGSLSLIVPTALWGGSRGKVPSDWVVFEPFSSSEVTEQPLFTAIFPDASQALTAAFSSPPPEAVESHIGVVLKHVNQDRYVATVASPAREPLFSLDALFPKGPDGHPQIPAEYRLEALYVGDGPEVSKVAAREAWLANVFFSPTQVGAAIREGSKTVALQNPQRGLTLYMSSSDQALLKLKVPPENLATELFQRGSDGGINDKGAQAEMAAGTLTPRNFLRRVIDATDLWVVRAGQFWREVGRVGKSTAVLATEYPEALSGSFLSSRDAALYAHEQIGNTRNRYLGGYILKGPDGHFVITPPKRSLGNPFAFMLFFPMDGQGALIPPEHYELHARYGSHPALSMVDPDWVKQRHWTWDEALINLQVFSCDEMYSILLAGRVAYLSGAQDCLLEYAPNRSSQEVLLRANLSPSAAEHGLARKLDRGEIKPTDWVTRLASAGEFKIIQGNSLWGPRGVVYSDWTPNYDYAPRLGPPDYVTYGSLFTTLNEATRDLHKRVHGRNLAAQACFAFILKRKDQEQYIATEVVGAVSAGDLFDLNRLFSRTSRDEFLLPEGFELHALFRSQQWSPQWKAVANTWLTLYFVMPEVLYSALYEAQRDRTHSLPIYFSTLDGALLSYQPSPIDVKIGGEADNLLAQARTQLDSGITTHLDFVRQWATKGELQVVRTSQCWDEVGKVGNDWAGYKTLTSRRLSPAFASPDDAARHALSAIGNHFRRAYGGVILKLANGLCVATEPLILPPRGVTLNWIYPDASVAEGLYPGGGTIIARYRSLPIQEVPILLSGLQKTVYQSMIPSAVLAELLDREVHIKREYVFGANGAILSYDLSDSEEEKLLSRKLVALNLVKGDLADNDFEQQLRTGALSPQDFVNAVAKAGLLRVVKGDALWGSPRTLKPDFALNQYIPNPLAVRQVAADTPCSPIFTRALDAVRHVQLGWKPQAQVAFGYVLKASGRELYMATLPLVRENFDALRAVFVDGQLPQGYLMYGLYLCASTETIAPASDEMARHFFTPVTIVKALTYMTTPRNGVTLPLYLLCADGALLWFRAPKTAAVSQWSNNVRHDATRVREGSLTVRDYVRLLAGIGELHVRVTSPTWGRKEQVDAQWSPKRPSHAFADDPYYHSFCGPLYFYADDAARYAQRLIAPFVDTSYLGAVLVPPKISGFVAIDPVEDRAGFGSSTLEGLFWKDHAGFDVPVTNVLRSYKIAAVHAFYKSIPSMPGLSRIDINLLANFASSDDLGNYLSVMRSNLPDAKSLYLSCRGGGMLKYIPAMTGEETAILRARPAATPSVLVRQLRRMGSLSVLVTDVFWNALGPLGEKTDTAGLGANEPWYGRNKDEL
jgi:hypothetical protein